MADIRRILLEGPSKRNIGAVVGYVGTDPQRFAGLVSLYEAEDRSDKVMAMRAAWAISLCVEHHPKLAGPHIRKFVGQLGRKDIHGGAKRNMVRLLQFVDVPRRLRAEVYSTCLELVADIAEPVAVRAFSITVAAKIAKDHPELMGELRSVVEMFADDPSPAFRSRARQIIPLSRFK